MNLIAVLAALALEQWRAFRWRASLERAFVRYARLLERRLNGGTVQQGVIAAVIALAPPVLIALALFWALTAVHPLLGLAWNVAALYLLMGFRRFSHAYSNVVAALKAGDINGARRALAGWRGGVTTDLSSTDVAKLAIERGLVDSYRQVFATLFWFILLPGPAGAVLYRAAALLADEWSGDAHGTDTTPIARARETFGRPARRLLWLLDWIPVRLTALSFAVVGDFEDAVYCWRTQAETWREQEGGTHAGILLASGGGALGVVLGGPVPVLGGEPDFRPEIGMGEQADAELLPSGVGLLWRALVLWLLLILLLTLANWAP
ncbi:MAG TPA: CobD/CbiB family protein [Burkholderiaceae bacterium]|nr:CobD/CbiB family protein [Burkholderiaceae bacterium]